MVTEEKKKVVQVDSLQVSGPSVIPMAQQKVRITTCLTLKSEIYNAVCKC